MEAHSTFPKFCHVGEDVKLHRRNCNTVAENLTIPSLQTIGKQGLCIDTAVHQELLKLRLLATRPASMRSRIPFGCTQKPAVGNSVSDIQV